jgi:hypothetical protein
VLHRAKKSEIAKEQLGMEGKAKREYQIAMKHGMELMQKSMVDAETGHEVMASVMLTLEMIRIQQSSAQVASVCVEANARPAVGLTVRARSHTIL